MARAARLLDRPEWETRATALVDRILEVFWDGSRLAHALASGDLQRQGFLSDAAALLLAVTMLREGNEGLSAVMKDLAGLVSSFRRDGRWIESESADFQAVEASWFDHPVPSPSALAKLALARATVLEGGIPEEAPWLRPHQADFHNIAALFARGYFHRIHSPLLIPWAKLPANSIQVHDANESDCYAGACRPLNLEGIGR